jgi:quercetin dioxygenase-like cupin family protein
MKDFMYKSIATIFAVAFTATVFAPNAIAQAPKKGGSAVLMAAGDLKWNKDENRQGVQTVVLQGDPAKGAHHALLKLAGGFTVPLHHHSADHYVTVLSGTMVFTVDGKDYKLPAGSYFSFIGKKQHVTKCETGADCVLAIDARGKWDVVPEESKPAAKK